jgi:ABC-type transporter Mla subunit MlaD
MADAKPRRGKQGCRRARQADVPRLRRVQFRLSEQEYTRLQAAARRAGLSLGAYAAQAAMDAISTSTHPGALIREAMTALDHAAGQVHRIGVNLNQAVARLNAAGQHSADLLPYAAASMRLARKLDQAADAVQRILGQ